MRQPCDFRYDDSDGFRSLAGGRKYPHTGSDWFAPEGSNAYAILPCTVTATGWHDGNGNYVAVQLPDGTYWSYIHLSSISVSVGQTLAEGAVVGQTGNTGTNSRGAHLHCSHSDDPRVYVGLGNLSDPWAYLNGAAYGSGGGSGSDSAETLWDQERLNVWAAFDGVPQIKEDGIRGGETIGRIRDFQSKHGLEVDGDAGPLTDAKLAQDPGAPVGHPFPGVTEWGTSGTGITRQYQQRLIELGYDLGPYGADDDHGTATTAAITKFQQDRGIGVDGVGGPETWAELWREAAVPAAPAAEASGSPAAAEVAAPKPVKPKPKPKVPARPKTNVVLTASRPRNPTAKELSAVTDILGGIPKAEVEEGALGSIVQDPKSRQRIYSVWILIGLSLSAFTAGLISGFGAAALATTAGWAGPAVVGIAILAGISGAYAALSPQVTMLARANVSGNKK